MRRLTTILAICALFVHGAAVLRAHGGLNGAGLSLSEFRCAQTADPGASVKSGSPDHPGSPVHAPSSLECGLCTLCGAAFATLAVILVIHARGAAAPFQAALADREEARALALDFLRPPPRAPPILS